MIGLMRTYLRALYHHPGTPVAFVLTFIGAVTVGYVGAAIMSVFWVPVLIDAWEYKDIHAGTSTKRKVR